MLGDVVLTFFTAFDNEGEYEYSLKKIALNYIFSYFVFDLLACFPSILVWESFDYKFCYYLKALRFMQIGRLFNQLGMVINKIKAFFMGIIDKILLDNAFQLIKTLMGLVYVLHIFSCVWIAIGFAHTKTKNMSGEGYIYPSWFASSGWCQDRISDFAVCIYSQNLKVYTTAFYFASTTATTVGYGDISGNNLPEYYFIMFTEFFGLAVFSIIMGSIGDL